MDTGSPLDFLMENIVDLDSAIVAETLIGIDDAMDIILLYDDSCGQSFEDCGNMLSGINTIIAEFLSKSGTRVQTMQFTQSGLPAVIVSFLDDELQNDIVKYTEVVSNFGECRNGGFGLTDLYTALNEAILYFDVDDYRKDIVIVVSACMDFRNDLLCGETLERLDALNIDVYPVNLIKASGASNVILNRPMAKEYLLCLASEDEDGVCVYKDKEGVSVDEFGYILDYCLLPHICDDHSGSNSYSGSFSGSFSSDSYSDSSGDLIYSTDYGKEKIDLLPV